MTTLNIGTGRPNVTYVRGIGAVQDTPNKRKKQRAPFYCRYRKKRVEFDTYDAAVEFSNEHGPAVKMTGVRGSAVYHRPDNHRAWKLCGKPDC